MQHKHIGRLLEFFIIGLLFGIAEDLIAVTVSTGTKITWNIIWIVALIALPFAIFSELIIDGLGVFKFWKKEMKDEVKVIEEKAGFRKIPQKGKKK